MGAVVAKPLGTIGPKDVQSPDLIFDIKETVHRTPYVANSVLPNLSKVDQDNEHDLLTLSSGTVIRLQTRQKDGNQGINLYKKELKSVPRELFNHPKARNVTWLNLACNTLVYNNNGIYVNVDKVAGLHNDSESSDSDMSVVEEEQRPASKTSKKSRSSSASSHSSKKEEKAAPEPALDIEAAEVVDAGADADDEGEDDEVVEAVPAEAFELNEGGDPKPATPKEAAAEAVTEQDGTAIEDYGKSARDLKSVADTIDTAGDFEGQSEKCDKELEHIEDDIHNIEEKPEGGVEEPEVEAGPEDAEDVEGAESPYDAVKAYELERQQEAEEAAKGTPSPVIPDFSEEKELWIGPVLASDEEGDDYDEEGEVVKRLPNTVPNSFDKMMNLEELYLGYYGKGNPLRCIPSTVFTLHSLVKLDASSCRLTTIPAAVGDLSSLEELWLSGNLLKELPKTLGKLQNLRSLWVNYNQLEGVPASLSNCQNLEGLYAHGNQIMFLSTALSSLQKLQYLGLGRNKLKFLPKNIGEMKKLKEAWLNDNELRSLPDSLFDIKGLKTLWLSANQLTSLDEKIGQLHKLKVLSLSKNQLTTLPFTLSNCANLRVLALDENKLVALPRSLNQLGYLEELWLNGNAVKEIPEGLYMISNMRKPI